VRHEGFRRQRRMGRMAEVAPGAPFDSCYSPGVMHICRATYSPLDVESLPIGICTLPVTYLIAGPPNGNTPLLRMDPLRNERSGGAIDSSSFVPWDWVVGRLMPVPRASAIELVESQGLSEFWKEPQGADPCKSRGRMAPIPWLFPLSSQSLEDKLYILIRDESSEGFGAGLQQNLMVVRRVARSARFRQSCSLKPQPLRGPHQPRSDPAEVVCGTPSKV
jgi:hypothetical protein